MELTKEQICKIEKFLDHKYFDAIDLRPEILDHMVSDVERKMSRNLSFESAFKMTVLKWDNHFKDTSSFFFGLIYTNSKIVVKKAVKLFKPFYFLYLAAYFLPVVFLKLYPIKVSESAVDFINGFLHSFSLALLGYMFFIIVKTKMSKAKTTFRLILLVIGLFVGVFDKNGSLNPVMTGFIFAGFAVVFICNRFYKKHVAVISKFKSV